MQHSKYIQDSNERISNKNIISYIEKSAKEIEDTIHDSIQSRLALHPTVHDDAQMLRFNNALLNFNSATEEAFSRILERDGVDPKTKAYSTLSFLVQKRYHIKSGPFDCLRSLRNKVCHVVNPSGVIKYFLFTNKINSMKNFLKDFSISSNEFIEVCRHRLREQNKENKNDADFFNAVAQKNSYKLKI